MEQLELPELTTEQTETSCSKVEGVAGKHVLSKVPSKKMEMLNLLVEAEGSKPLNLSIEVHLTFPPLTKGINQKTSPTKSPSNHSTRLRIT